MCRNVRSIKWHQKTYHEISWDYPFKTVSGSWSGSKDNKIDILLIFFGADKNYDYIEIHVYFYINF
jgi:hypothetical protein